MAWRERGQAGTGPLRAWHDPDAGKTWRWLQRETGLHYRTLTKVAAGATMNGVTASALAKATGIDIETLIRQGR